MAEYQVTSWRELPSLVVAREGDEVTKAPLPPRFQHAIDEAAMRSGESDSDAYLAGWRRSEWRPVDGTPAQAAEAVTAELVERWDDAAVEAYLDSLTPDSAVHE
jgi:Virulence factor